MCRLREALPCVVVSDGTIGLYANASHPRIGQLLKEDFSANRIEPGASNFKDDETLLKKMFQPNILNPAPQISKPIHQHLKTIQHPIQPCRIEHKAL